MMQHARVLGLVLAGLGLWACDDSGPGGASADGAALDGSAVDVGGDGAIDLDVSVSGDRGVDAGPDGAPDGPAGSAPIILDGEAFAAEQILVLHLDGSDADGDVVSVEIEILAGDDVLGLLSREPEPSVAGEVEFEIRMQLQVLAGFPGADAVRVWLRDATDRESERRLFELGAPPEVGPGEPCDPAGVENRCGGGQACGDGDVCVDGCQPGDCAAGQVCQEGRCETCEPRCAGRKCGDDGCGGSCGDCGPDVCVAGDCCERACDGRDCGPDGCGGICGECAGACLDGQCCEPACDDRACGPDGCGGVCGACEGLCIDGDCCVPDCADAVCGSDGCGGVCGLCGEGELCADGACVPGECEPECEGRDCGFDGCGGVCGECAGVCLGGACCEPACDGRDCGPDGCGGVCGDAGCGGVCLDGQCCVPDCDGRVCGSDGCGGACGACPVGEPCIDGQCEAPQCEPNCGDRVCGPDGCGGVCGECDGVCLGGVCCEPACEGRDCGPDGCGGVCGEVDCEGVCLDGQCCAPDCDGAVCGPDGCDGVCGACGPDQVCAGGACVRGECVPQCEGRNCGFDGCGGSCGDCAGACIDGRCCVPDCDGRVCGSDGCGGVCGACAGVCIEGQCCEPDCDGRDCGPNGCGGVCGPACANGVCQDGQCCAPDCNGRVCGPDGCNGRCGLCPVDQLCQDGQCVDECVPDCVGRECGPNGCGGSCGQCGLGEGCDDGTCVPGCVPACDGAECGPDGCGGVCGQCLPGEVCRDGECGPEVCVPRCNRRECGPDGCGGVCGDCDGLACNDGQCCRPSCLGRDCGSDGCGGSCGDCEGVCAAGRCCEPQCDGRECGPDGCGGLCGSCGPGVDCFQGQCVENPPQDWILIPAGEFLMGSPDDERGRSGDEVQHPVSIEKAFLIRATEVSQGEWLEVMLEEPSRFAGCDDCPVEQVSWADSVRFLNALSDRDGLERCYDLSGNITAWRDRQSCLGYRLPTEAEWEYAARSGALTPFTNGAISVTNCNSVEPNLNQVAWYCFNSEDRTHVRGGKLPNARGMLDVHGNVSEWTWDRYGPYIERIGLIEADPLGPHTGGQRVHRGGAWNSSPQDSRLAHRFPGRETDRLHTIGLRPVRTFCAPQCAGRVCGDDGCGGQCGICGPGQACGDGACQQVRAEPAPNYVLLEAGRFLRGARDDEPGRRGDEDLTEVQINRPFWIAATEVTQRQWAEVMQADPSRFEDCEECPVERVSWLDAVAFANTLSEREGRETCYEIKNNVVAWPLRQTCLGYRLPTESEWEYAARAGAETSAPDGHIQELACRPIDAALDAVGWYCGNSFGRPWPVGSKPGNAWGLFDMHGNVSEWTWDHYGPYIERVLFVEQDPLGPHTGGARRVSRGGSFSTTAQDTRVADRVNSRETDALHTQGVRLARTACTPNCGARECGDDGCGRPCGICGNGEVCDDGACAEVRPEPEPGWVLLEAGEYVRGSPNDEPSRAADEEQHRVRIDLPFLMQATEVTQGQWREVMLEEPSQFDDCAECPVERVSWNDAIAFANRMSDAAGLERCYDETNNFLTWPKRQACLGFRLPTEAEWEYAARAGTVTPFAGGDLTEAECRPIDPALDATDWYCGNSFGRPWPVGTRPGNPWGLFDLHGNVSEWTWDWHGAYPIVIGVVADDPLGPHTGSRRVVRGGNFTSLAGDSRSAERGQGSVAERVHNRGLRLVRTWCEPECDGKSCGDDGCGGQCGVCEAGQTCDGEGQCEQARPSPEPGYVLIDAGEYTRGSPIDEAGRRADELEHTVQITRPFLMKATEVTQLEWRLLMREEPSQFPDCEDCPVERVQWLETIEYLNRLSDAEGFERCYVIEGNIVSWPKRHACTGYRLPTEAEWEFAARAGAQTALPQGDLEWLECRAIDLGLDQTDWYCGNSFARPWPVGSRPANPWGLFDMHGNVRELTWDWYGAYPQGVNLVAVDPVGPHTGSRRVARGGAFEHQAQDSRSARRHQVQATSRTHNTGFRPVRTFCVPQCDGRSCGDDGCGGFCGPGCGAGEVCDAGQCEQVRPEPAPGWVLLEPGEFERGSPEDEIGRSADEPQHQVRITRPFWARATEVTQAEWAQVMNAEPSRFRDCPECPVERVDWDDAIDFLNALSERDNLEPCYQLVNNNTAWRDRQACDGYRLPTEAEWEYAARAGLASAFPGGDISEPDCRPVDGALDPFGWYCGNSFLRPWPVGQRAANPWGLYDMHGNVRELTWDRYGPYPQGLLRVAVDPIGPHNGGRRVARGGSYDLGAAFARSAARAQVQETETVPNLGLRPFRTACTPQCDGLTCGDDGCGRYCGLCDAGQVCADGACAQAQPSPQPGWVLVPAGQYTRGSPADEPGRGADETQHPVTLTRDLLVRDTEVTQAEWIQVMGNDPSRFGDCADCAMEGLRWLDAIEFTNALSVRDGLVPCYVEEGANNWTWPEGPDCDGYRLPTEAEWEYFARAGAEVEIGENECRPIDPELDATDWYCGNAFNRPWPVGSKARNPWGLADLRGNVAEWVWDRYAAYADEAQVDPMGPPAGNDRVIRGGAFTSVPGATRPAARRRARFNSSANDVGLRLVRTAP